MGFLEKKKISSKCSNCSVYKKKLVDTKTNKSIIAESGTKEILFITDMVEHNSNIPKFQKYLKDKGIHDYRILTGLKCRSRDFELPSPVYTIYKECNMLTQDILDETKVIVTMGRSINAVTKNDDLMNWTEFNESLFNQTYFYTGFDQKRKIKVYPIPFFQDWLTKDNFEKYFVNKQLSKIKNDDHTPLDFVEPKKVFIDDPNQFMKENMGEAVMSWDIEATGLDHYAPDYRIICVTLTFDGVTGYFLPWEKINKRVMSNFLKDKYQILAGGKYDTLAFELAGIKNFKIAEDIPLLFHVLNTERTLNSIKSLAWLIGFGGYENELDEYIKKNKIKSYGDIPSSILNPYAMLDPIVTFRLYEFAKEHLIPKQPDVYKAYKEVLIPVLPVFQKMQVSGMPIDFDKLNDLNAELLNEAKELKLDLEKELGGIDIGSSQQLAKALELRGLPAHGRGKKFWIDDAGEKHFYFKTGVPILKKWSKYGHKIADRIMRYRKVAKLQDTFVGSYSEEETNPFFQKISNEKASNDNEGLVKFIKEDKMIHPIISPGRTNTWRASSQGPNIQNQSKRGEEGKRLRPIFTYPEGYLIGEADYSGFQLRIAAVYSGDEVMKDIFLNKGGDMHSITSQGVIHRDMSVEEVIRLKGEEPYKTSRGKSKGINFGFVFGREAYSFRADIEEEWTAEEIEAYIMDNNLTLIEADGEPDAILTVADDIRTKFFQTYPMLMPWIKDQHKFGEEYGFVFCPQGARRHLPAMQYKGKDYDKKRWTSLQNISVNSPVQSFEAIEIYRAIIDIDKKIVERRLQSYMVAMVHDSIVLMIHRSEIKEMYDLLKECMEDHTNWPVPLVAEMELGEVWGFSKELKEKNMNDFIGEYRI